MHDELRRLALLALCASPLALMACGSARVQDSDARFDAAVAAAVSPSASGARSRLASAERAAQRAYDRETRGSKLERETARIAGDPTLLDALARGDVAAAQAAAQAQLLSAANHFEHVTRISIVSAGRVLVNATLNADGAFVDAPASRQLTVHGRGVGTLLVSIQDVTGFVKLVHRSTLAEVLARGASGQVRTSLPAAAQLRLPAAGSVTIAGQGYLARSFRELAWAGEPLEVWLLVRA